MKVFNKEISLKKIYNNKTLLFKFTIYITLIFLFITLFNYFYIFQTTKTKLYSDHNKIPDFSVALVLGAHVYPNGNLSSIYQDRVESAYKLYQEKKVQKILISADNSRKEYNETIAAGNYLLNKGVPKEDIFLDYAGFDTYDSIYRAKEIYKVKDLIIVTQEFHLPRSVFIAQSLNLNVAGYIADRQQYRELPLYKKREFLAIQKAVINIVFNSKPKYLGPPIPVNQSSLKSWNY